MIISLAKETLPGERRPVLLPASLAPFQRLPVSLFIETGIGGGLSIPDTAYQLGNATIVDTRTAWEKADILLKLKRPTLDELRRLRRGSTICALFHAEACPEIVDYLLHANIKAYAYEYFCLPTGEYPLMAATGEIAGKQAVIYAAYHLQSHIGGSGRLLPRCQFTTPARVVVLGYGHVGQSAAKTASALGADTIVFRRNPMSSLVGPPPGVTFVPWSQEAVECFLPTTDVVIGAIRISTFDTPAFLTKDIIQRMRPGSVIVDVTAGYGAGFIETAATVTTLQQPYVINYGVKHIKIRQLPLGVHLSAAESISAVYGPHLIALVESLVHGYKYETAECGKITEQGTITHEEVRRHYAVRYDERLQAPLTELPN